MIKFLVAFSMLLWGISLALPAMVYESSKYDNPAYNHGCEYATGDYKDYQCVAYPASHSIHCLPPKESAALGDRGHIMSSKEVWDYYKCTAGWDTPVAHKDYGYTFFLEGWLGILMGNFAWWGNAFFFLSFFCLLKNFIKTQTDTEQTLKKRYKLALIYSILGLGLGLTVFMIETIPKSESGAKWIVDHLAVGGYVWLSALGLMVLTNVMTYFTMRNTSEIPTTNPIGFTDRG